MSTPGTPNSIKNCKIVRAFSCYSGTNPGPSNTQSPDQHQEIRSSQNPRSTEETEEYAIWYPNGSSAPFFSQEMSSQATFDHDQPAKFPARLLLYPSRGVLLGGQSFLDVNRYMIKINYGADIGEFQCVICGKIVSWEVSHEDAICMWKTGICLDYWNTSEKMFRCLDVYWS